MSSPPKPRGKSWAASQSFDSLSATDLLRRQKRLQALTRPGKGAPSNWDRTPATSRVATERGGGGGGSGWARRPAVALALALGALMCGGLYWFIFRGATAASVARTAPAPTPAPTPRPTSDAWVPPAIVIVLREASSAQVAASHGAHLLHATVHRALAASPRSKVAVLHNAPAHMGHGEPLARLARDFAPSVTLFSAMARDASPRQAFVSRHCTRARYDQIPGHSRSAGASSDGSLCASQAFRRLMTAVDFLHSHAEEWAPGPTSVVLLVEPGTLLFFGEQHLRKLSMRLPQRRGVLTSLEGLGHDVRHNSGSGSAGSVPFSRCGLEHDPTLQAVAKQPHKRKATPHKPHEAAPAQPGAAAAPSAASSRVARRKGGEKPRAEERSRGARRLADAAATDHAEVALAPPLSPPPLDVGAPALLATAEGLRGLLGAAARALVRDLSLPEPNGAAWWRDPAPWFDPDAQQNDAKDFEGRKAASSSGAQDRQVESAFSGDAWAQFLADAPPSTQLPRTLDLVAEAVARRCPGLLRHANASVHLDTSVAAAASAATASAASASNAAATGAAATEGVLPGDLTERRWRRFLGFFERQLSSGSLLRQAPTSHARSHARKEGVAAKGRDGKRVAHVKLAKTVPQWSCALSMVHPQQLANSPREYSTGSGAGDGDNALSSFSRIFNSSFSTSMRSLSSISNSSLSSSTSSLSSTSSRSANCTRGLVPAFTCLPLAAGGAGGALVATDAKSRAWLVPIAALPLSRALVASAQGAALWHQHDPASTNQQHSRRHRRHPRGPEKKAYPLANAPHLANSNLLDLQSAVRAARGLDFGLLTDQFTVAKAGKWGKALRADSAGARAADVDRDTADVLRQFVDHNC